MEHIKQISENSILWTSLLAWLIAQALKVLWTVMVHKKLDLRRFVGAGGMPSSHTALVVSLATSVGGEYGFDSPIFAIAIIFALIVMYDAAGVRRAAGKQAAVLNDILERIHSGKDVPHEKLKELIGHTPIEVIAGAILGFIVSKIVL
ncbi:MAG: divergent PAP2 family protein [Clostridiales bacterium]|jgi:acid phosphatase family membrane protein YuiD|nr:divergent PAP2 family protein [Clostridiales bacterium]